MNGRFVLLDPPGDGLQSVLSEGRRRRRRRAAGTSAAGATVLAGVLGLALLSGPGGGTDSLQPPPAAPGVIESPSPDTAVTPEPSAASASPGPSGSPAPSASPEPAPGVAQPTRSPRPAPPPPSPSEATAAGYRTPDLQRAYAGPPGAATFCSPQYSNDPSEGRVAGWCVRVSAERTAQGADLVVAVCRDGASSASRLTFGTDHEVDLAVLQDSRTLWQWSVGRTPRDDEHELAADSGGCWSWRAPWTGVDQDGRELDSGSYVLRARSEAAELEGAEPADASFSL